MVKLIKQFQCLFVIVFRLSKTKKMNKIVWLIGCLVAFLPAFAQTTGSISGTVINKQSQQPISGISVQVEGSTRGTTTDSLGRFRITNIPVKTYAVKFSGIGFADVVKYNIIISSGNEYTVLIEMENNSTELNNVTVKNNRRSVKAATLETPLSVQRLTTEEIRANPGGNFDISKVIQSLPGVGGGAAGGGFRNDIIIRGGAPNENVFYIDGIEIPTINHFATQGSSGGPQGILNVSFIEEVKLSTSAFDARFDNALSSVFEFKQKKGNANRVQGNIRLSATELATTFEGPLSKNKKHTFLASARRSYLQFLFQAIDLPIRPNYWDFQFKTTHQLNAKTTLTFLGVGAIDEFSFAAPKTATPEKLYALNSSPSVQQWSYTFGTTLKRLVKNGYWNLALSRNDFNNELDRYENNLGPNKGTQTLGINSGETETKLRFDVNKNRNGWKLAYGAVLQQVNYSNRTFQIVRPEVRDNSNTIIQPAVLVNYNTNFDFTKAGAFVQVGKKLMDNRLGLSGGIRVDGNSFTENGWDIAQTFSPRISASYVLTDNWNLNAAIGRYSKIPPYTILGYIENGEFINSSSKYINSTHYSVGIEHLKSDATRFTLEGFYKRYSNVPVSVRDGISLSNMGSDFNVLGNEPIISNGKGRTYGVEFFAQQKLTNRFFGVLSATLYRSEYSGANGNYAKSAWDNGQLLSLTGGYKFNKNWELGLKFRYQGGAPYTPFNETASRQNFLTLGQGILDYSRLNTQRLRSFHSSDIRIDKKWNFKKTTFDLFLDISNWYLAKSAGYPQYTFKRNDTNTAFVTTDGLPVNQNGSNAIPFLLDNEDGTFTPTIGFIIEF
jgi:hypothetical protein